MGVKDRTQLYFALLVFFTVFVFSAGQSLWRSSHTDVNVDKRKREELVWCTINREEQQKCLNFANANERDVIKVGYDRVHIKCKQAFNKDECMQWLDEEKATLTTLDAGEMFIGGRYHSLVPIAQEVLEGGFKHYYAVAVVKKDGLPDVQSLHDLRGKKACFAGVETFAGWILPINTLMKEGGMNIIDCNNHVKTATNYFGPSCAVNCLSDKYNPIGDNSDKLCKLCIGKIPGGRCTDTDPYAGYEGAFKCLLEVGEIAFLKHNTVPELVAQLSFAGMSIDNFELLCKDGTRRPVNDYLSCHWGQVPSNAVATSSAVSFEDRTRYQKFLQKFSERYGKRAANGSVILPTPINPQQGNRQDPFGNSGQPIEYDEFGNPRQPVRYDQFGNPQQRPDFSQTQYDEYGNRVNRFKRQNFGDFGTQNGQNNRNNPYGQGNNNQYGQGGNQYGQGSNPYGQDNNNRNGLDTNPYKSDSDNPYRQDNNQNPNRNDNGNPYTQDNNPNPYKPDDRNPYRSDNNQDPFRPDNSNPYGRDNDNPYRQDNVNNENRNRQDNENRNRQDNDNPYRSDNKPNNENNPYGQDNNNENPYRSDNNNNQNRNQDNDNPYRQDNPPNRDNNDPFARDPYLINPDKYGQNIDPYNTDIPKYNQDDRLFPSNPDYPRNGTHNGTYYEVFSLFDSSPKYGVRANLMFQDVARAIAPVSEATQTYTNFLGDSLKVIMGVRDCPVGRMTLCVTSDAENNKCVKMRTALKAQLLKPEIECYKAHSQIDCMKAIQGGIADVAVLDASDVYTAGLQYHLVPFISEVYNLEDAEYYVVAVAKESDPSTELTYLRGKDTCHGGINTAAGWVYPLAFLISNGWIRPYGCNSIRAAAEYFSKSCVPGALSTEYNTGVPYDNMCDLCHGPSFRYCRRDASEDYYGHTGAFRCLVEGGGHVAFVKHTTVTENTGGKKREWWARDNLNDDFELLCPDGTRAEINEYTRCNLGKVKANAIVTREIHTRDEINAFINLFMYAQTFYGRRTTDEFSFSLFTSEPPYSDLIFQDATTKLRVIEPDMRYFSTYLGSDFMRARRIVDCHAGSIKISASFITVLLLGIVLYF